MRYLGFVGVVVAACVVGCGVMTADTYAEVTCPPGSLRAEEGEGTANSLAECNLPVPKDDDPTLMGTVKKILDVVIGVVGVVAVAVIIIGGIFFVISQGDSSKITRARNTILYGVVGLVVSLLAFAIVNFVLSSVFNGGSKDGGGGTSEEGGGDAANP